LLQVRLAQHHKNLYRATFSLGQFAWGDRAKDPLTSEYKD